MYCVLFLFVCFVSIHGFFPPSNVSSYQVDLYLPPEQRFQTIASTYRTQIQAIASMLSDLVPQYVFDVLDEIVPFIDDFFLGDYGAEVRGISEATGVSLTDTLLLNLFYDLTTTCTSIVGVNSNGLVVHGRNQDYPRFFQPVLIQVDYMQNSTLLFKATTFAGFTGVPTGMNSQFSISLNARSTNGSLWDNALEALFGGGINPTYLAREMLSSNYPFEQVRATLASRHIIAPIYYTIAGTKPGEGTIISRSREATDNFWDIGNTPTNWFVTQTNFDHWLPCPTTDCRFQTAQSSMAQTGWVNYDMDALNSVLLTPPILNNFTLYTTLMIPAQGAYFTYSRDYITNNPYCPN